MASIHTVYRPFLRHFRTKRMSQFAAEFLPEPATTIIDVGGTAANWDLLDREAKITLVNLESARQHGETGRYTFLVGDATDLDFADDSFDICFSNSVVEHVGSFDDQRAYAAEVRRVAKGLWVQTPARWFWIEPHYLAPFVHWLPPRIRRRVVRYLTPWGLLTRPTQEQVDDRIEEIRLLTFGEMVELFPDCEIRRERWLGMTKSFIAVRGVGAEVGTRPPLR